MRVRHSRSYTFARDKYPFFSLTRNALIDQIEEQIEGQYRLIQKKIKELEPGKLRAYNDLLAKQRELQERTVQNEGRLNELTARIRQYESDDKSNSLRKEYLSLEKTLQTLRRDADSLHEELEIANLVSARVPPST